MSRAGGRDLRLLASTPVRLPCSARTRGVSLRGTNRRQRSQRRHRRSAQSLSPQLEKSMPRWRTRLVGQAGRRRTRTRACASRCCTSPRSDRRRRAVRACGARPSGARRPPILTRSRAPAARPARAARRRRSCSPHRGEGRAVDGAVERGSGGAASRVRAAGPGRASTRLGTGAPGGSSSHASRPQRLHVEAEAAAPSSGRLLLVPSNRTPRKFFGAPGKTGRAARGGKGEEEEKGGKEGGKGRRGSGTAGTTPGCQHHARNHKFRRPPPPRSVHLVRISHATETAPQ